MVLGRERQQRKNVQEDLEGRWAAGSAGTKRKKVPPKGSSCGDPEEAGSRSCWGLESRFAELEQR